MTQILTNSANNSIILTLNNTLSSDSNIISMEPGESVLYDSVAVTNSFDPNYNIPLLEDYIASGALVLETLTAEHQSELQVLPQANLTIGLGSGVPELVNKTANVISDNLQVLPVVDTLGRVLCIYYRSVQGMLISTDLGVTQTLISNDNLLFPEEITSFGVQTYESNGGVLIPIKRLFVGTLREGIKTFVPGDSTYTDYDPNTVFAEDMPAFKNCLKTINVLNSFTQGITTVLAGSFEIGKTYKIDVPGTTVFTGIGAADNVAGTVFTATGVGSGTGTAYLAVTTVKTDITFPNFCPTYVLGVVNKPNNSGCPIFVASRPKYTQITVTNNITVDSYGTQISSVTTTVSDFTNVYKTKIAVKYLHEKLYASGSQKLVVLDIFAPAYYGLSSTSYTSNRWLLLQENTTVATDLSGIVTFPTFPQHVLDVVTEYTVDGMLVIVKDNTNTNRLYKVLCSENVITSTGISQIDLPLELHLAQIRNISKLIETGTTNYNIFVTTGDEVWRYSSSTEAWENFIYATNPIGYLNTSVDNGILSGTSGPTHLKNLTNFVLVPKLDSSTAYIGLLGTELGILFYDLKLVNSSFTTEMKFGRTLLLVAKSGISDLKVAMSSANIYAFVCSYSSQVPKTYSNDVNCLQLINQNSRLTQAVIYIKPDIESTSDSIYYVSEDALILNSIPTGEQKSYIPVLIDINHSYDLISPTYAFKLKSLVITEDTVLLTALDTFLAYKYYFPVITERIIASVNKMEPTTLQLNDYKHPVRIYNIISLNNNDVPVDLGTTTTVSSSLQAILPIFIDNGHTQNAIVCIRNDGKTIIPSSIIQIRTKQYIDSVGGLDYTKDQWQTTISFSERFTGTLFVTTVGSIYTETVSGLFTVVTHDLGKYPQAVIDSSVLDQLNDIKYIDDDRLEISFKSSVNTTVLFK